MCKIVILLLVIHQDLLETRQGHQELRPDLILLHPPLHGHLPQAIQLPQDQVEVEVTPLRQDQVEEVTLLRHVLAGEVQPLHQVVAEGTGKLYNVRL